jgi:hypothetical protein
MISCGFVGYSTRCTYSAIQLSDNGMVGQLRSRVLAILLTCVGLLQPCALPADTVAVHYKEGLVHGFLVLRTLDGKTLAVGDLTQTAQGDAVTTNVVFHFHDGSIHDETTVFSQRDNFKLLKYRLVQKGPAFKHAIDTSIDTSTGEFTARYQDDDGKEKVLNERLDVPADIANGMVALLLKNVPTTTQQITLSMVAATPKPRTVKLAITAHGEEPFLVGDSRRKATHYIVKVELGGAAGVIAPVVGKQPPVIHLWILRDDFPVFVKSEGPLFESGPIWVIELTNATWPRGRGANPPKK